MVAGTAEVTIVRCSLLFAMGRADAAVHVENESSRMAVMNLVDPHPVHVDQGFNVLVGGQAPSRSVPSGWWKRPVFRWPCRQQSSAWRDRVPDGRRRSHRHSRQGARKRTGETDPSCRAIRSCRTAILEAPSAISVRPRASQAPGRQASEVILEPWNSSFNRRSKTTRRHPGFDSPIGCAMTESPSRRTEYRPT